MKIAVLLIVLLDPSGYGTCYGTQDRVHPTLNVLFVCDSGLEIIYPWELLAPWWAR